MGKKFRRVSGLLTSLGVLQLRLAQSARQTSLRMTAFGGD
jgi:hypothetical protein